MNSIVAILCTQNLHNIKAAKFPAGTEEDLVMSITVKLLEIGGF